MKKAVRLFLCILIPWVLMGSELQAAMNVGPYPDNHGSCRNGVEVGAGGADAAADFTTAPARGGELQTDDQSNNAAPGLILVALNSPDPGGRLFARKTQAEEKTVTPEKDSGIRSGDRNGDRENDNEDDEDDEDDLDGFEEEFGKSMDSKISDPFEGYNRVMTSFNDGFYTYVFDPVARGYRFIVPEFGRRRIADFSRNLLFPIRFVNNLLQAKFLNAGEELLRFCINSTLGLLGLWDPAKVWFGLEAHEEDFGQTLGYWGVGAGPHIVLPFLGPSNMRDVFSIGPDYYLDPKRFIDPSEKEFAVTVLDKVNETSLHIGEYENLKKDAIDLYPFLRDVYEQNRMKKIRE